MNEVMANGVKLNYRLEGPGTGQVVMLSHSLASCLSAWDSQVAALSDAGFRVLAYDSRGHGGSDVPPGPYTMNMLAADALALLDFLGIEKVHFCGLSMGGMVGQLLGARNPERLFSLVLSSTSPYMPPPRLWDERIKEVRNKGMKSVADATIDRWFTGKGRKQMPERVKAVKDMIMKTPPEGFCACCEGIRDMDFREVLPSISVPTLVIVGSLDQGTPVSSAEYMCSSIGSAQLKIIADSAHFVNVEHPRIFNQELIEFLNSDII